MDRDQTPRRPPRHNTNESKRIFVITPWGAFILVLRRLAMTCSVARIGSQAALFVMKPFELASLLMTQLLSPPSSLLP